jgi:cysteine desulfuration protein SufE
MVPAPLQEQIDNVLVFEDRQSRIEALIALADEYRARPIPDVPRDDSHRVPACESEVYMHAIPEGDAARFEYAVDNPQGMSAMALARILEEGLSGVPLGEVAKIPDEIVYDIFGRELSMGKSAGLMGMVQMARAAAARRLRG